MSAFGRADRGVVVDDEVKLQQAAKRNPHAVVVAGEWIAAA
jgi:hypothetical protein